MKKRLLVAMIVALPQLAGAEPLSCDLFKSRLEQTVRDMGGLVAPPGTMKPSYDNDTGKRFAWSGDAGIAGTMTCGKTGAFEDFSVAIDEATRTSDGLAIALDRLMELASASICTIAEAQPKDCRALARKMTGESLAQFGNAAKKGETVPTGTRDFVIVTGVDAEIDMTPVGITWSIGPGLSMSVDAGKRPLQPRNLDQ